MYFFTDNRHNCWGRKLDGHSGLGSVSNLWSALFLLQNDEAEVALSDYPLIRIIDDKNINLQIKKH